MNTVEYQAVVDYVARAIHAASDDGDVIPSREHHRMAQAAIAALRGHTAECLSGERRCSEPLEPHCPSPDRPLEAVGGLEGGAR